MKSSAREDGGGTKWLRVEYKCTGCGATDQDKVIEGQQPVLTINCWKCRAGRGLEPQQMVVQRKGMFQTGNIWDEAGNLVDEHGNRVTPAKK